MGEYRKKPIVIEAQRFDHISAGPHIVDWIEGRGGEAFLLAHESDGDAAVMIRTLEGDMRADFGDWVIRGVKGEFYPCKSDIFEATYDAVPDQSDLLLGVPPEPSIVRRHP